MFIGIDPGIHNTAITFLDDFAQYVEYHYFQVDPSIKGYEAISMMAKKIVGPNYSNYGGTVILEIPEYHPKWTPSVNKIMLTAAMAGCLVYQFRNCFFKFVKPKEWKGQIPKNIHRKQIKAFCLQKGIPIPTGEKDNEHVWDSLGLAIYGYANPE